MTTKASTKRPAASKSTQKEPKERIAATKAKAAKPVAQEAAPLEPASSHAPAILLEKGDSAPSFTLPGAGGETLSLAALAGKKVVLYFYPKDDTSGCTKEAIEFNALRDKFAKAGAVIVGMSPDSPKSHDKFRAKYELGFPLAADETKATLSAYGVWVEKSMYGRKYMGVERSTFLIDAEGRVARIWRKVKVPGHVEEVLAAVEGL